MGEFRMPSLGADMVAGKLVQWMVHPGDRVTRGQIIAEVETEKGVVEVEVFEDGEVEALLVEPGARVPVGTALASIKGTGPPSTVTGAVPPRAPGPAAAPPRPAMPAPPAAPGEAGPPVRRRVSPLARKRAEALGVPLESVTGTGPSGVVTVTDVEAARAAPLERLPAMRRAIAAAMSRSKREIPHYYLATDVDVAPLMEWLAAENAARPLKDRLLVAAPLLKAVALALVAHPSLNGTWVDGQFRPSPAVHLGVGISLRQGGLVAPALHDASRRSVGELMAALSDLIRRVRAGSVKSSELSDPTVTVTSLGDTGVPLVFGVIFPPQVAILGLGRIVTRPFVVGGGVAPRPVLTVTLSADHRVSNGHEGARFLRTLERLLREPAGL